jgi:hypothetical protein
MRREFPANLSMVCINAAQIRPMMKLNVGLRGRFSPPPSSRNAKQRM